MKYSHFAVVVGSVLAIASCSVFQKKTDGRLTQARSTDSSTDSSIVLVENQNREAYKKAISLTDGWPESSVTAAKEMVVKHGDPNEVTSDSLIWRNVAPFKKIVVHREIYSSRFPLLHRDSLEHIVDYRAPDSKVDDIWKYNGSIVLNQTKGEISSFAESEAMNILSLNLAHEIMTGKKSANSARTTFGKETLNFLNGNKTAYTQVLGFGSQYETANEGVSVTNKIRWMGDKSRRPTQNINTRQAQEAKQ